MTKQYTPTSDQVKRVYCKSPVNLTDEEWKPVADEQFDRWIAKVKADAWDEGRKFGELPDVDKRYCLCLNSSHHELNPYRTEAP